MAGRHPTLPPRFGDEKVFVLEYYHPELDSLQKVKESMAPYIQKDGYYLVRNSFSRPNVYTISVIHQKSIKHFNVERTNTEFYLESTHTNSMDGLIKFYYTNDVPNMERVKHVRLRYPITRFSGGPHRRASVPSQRPSSDRRPSDTPTPPSPSNLQLPTRVPSEKKGMFAGRKRTSSESSSMNRMSIENRPPAPLPHEEVPPTPLTEYSQVRDVNEDVSVDLINALRIHEEGCEGPERCDCGLYLHQSELPMGWSMHISKDQASMGRLFFMSSDRKTTWNLPTEVTCELNTNQREIMKALYRRQSQQSSTMLDSGGAAAGGSPSRNSAEGASGF